MNMEVKNVHYRYGRNEILKGISFCLHSGEVLFILGQNGAGKSTLLRCMLGLNRDYEGDILLDGQVMKHLRPGQIARRAAYIPQIHQPRFDYTVLDVVLMGAASTINAFSAPSPALRQKAEQILCDMNISHLKDKGYMYISGGERQLAIIARALMQEASILLMDEPVSGLDFGNQQRALMVARTLSEHGYGVAVTSHHPEHAFMYADRVMVLEGGRVAALGAPKEVLTEAMLERIYGISIRLIDCVMDKKRYAYVIRPCKQYESERSEKRWRKSI